MTSVNKIIKAHIKIVIALIISICMILLLLLSLLYMYSLPYSAIKNYIESRYNMDHSNIWEKVEVQKSFLDDSLSDAGFWFYDFSRDVELFSKNRLCSRILFVDIYKEEIGLKEQKYKVKVAYKISSDIFLQLDQNCILDMEIFLKRSCRNSCKIVYIRELGYQMDLNRLTLADPEDEYEHEYIPEHEHNPEFGHDLEDSTEYEHTHTLESEHNHGY
ncbi:MAG: hypothetical protein PHG48_03665 [Eubacteriales bacterium]|nr:hypothetical protein [Eubacteriales bacterium]